MRLLQKIEIGLGIGVFVSQLVSLYVIHLPLAQSVAEMRNESLNLRILFLFNILPGIIVAICTYFHATRRSLFAFFATFAICGLVTFLLLATTLLGNAFMGHPLIGTFTNVYWVCDDDGGSNKYDLLSPRNSFFNRSRNK